MVPLIYIICIDLCALIFMIFSAYCSFSKKPVSFLWNDGDKKISQANIKYYNKGVAILYAFLSLCFMVLGLVSNYLGIRLSNILLILVLSVGFPTLSYAYSFLVEKYKK